MARLLMRGWREVPFPRACFERVDRSTLVDRGFNLERLEPKLGSGLGLRRRRRWFLTRGVFNLYRSWLVFNLERP